MIALITEFAIFYAVFYGINSLIGFLRNLISKEDKRFVTEDMIDAQKKKKRMWSLIWTIGLMIFSRLVL